MPNRAKGFWLTPQLSPLSPLSLGIRLTPPRFDAVIPVVADDVPRHWIEEESTRRNAINRWHKSINKLLDKIIKDGEASE
jgi:hypothetical protein